MDYEWFDEWFHTNTREPFKLSEAFWPTLLASDNGIVASLIREQGRRGIPVLGVAYYKSSKAAIDNLFLDVACKGKQDGIRVITISPGRVATGGKPGIAARQRRPPQCATGSAAFATRRPGPPPPNRTSVLPSSRRFAWTHMNRRRGRGRSGCPSS